MERIEYRNVIDKSEWPRGEWDNEPDKIQWPDEATGLPCLIVRSHMGCLCGYVGVAEGHPLHGKTCHDASELEAHGGLSYSDFCMPEIHEAVGICYRPGKGEPDHIWWLGFDRAHAGDLYPSMFREHFKAMREYEEVYRNVEYVTQECRQLAKQLKELA